MFGRMGMMSRHSLAAGFDPESISGLVLWLDSKDPLTILNASDNPASDGENVKTWSDKSSSGEDAVQATVLKQPIYRASGTEFSVASLQFDDVVNSTQLLNTTSGSQSAGNTEFIVFANGAAGGSAGSMISGGTSTGHLVGENGHPGGGVTMFQHAGAVVNQSLYAFDTPAVMTLQYNGASSKHWNDGSLVGTANAGANTGTGYSMGALYTGGGPCDCEIAAYLIYNSVLGDTDRQAVEAYLTSRYSV